MCERFFSKAGYALTDKRSSLSPANFEQQLFLYVNSRFWSIREVEAIVNDPSEERGIIHPE